MPIAQARMRVVRRVTHQVMDRVAPMVGYAASSTAKRAGSGESG
jgi:hypothetical protein